jgi:GDP-L-fucose synthase
MNLGKVDYSQHTEPMLSHINVGCGNDLTIRELAETVSKVVGYPGELAFDSRQPDGTPRKLMDSSRINALGWHAKVRLEAGLKMAYEDFLKNYKS